MINRLASRRQMSWRPANSAAARSGAGEVDGFSQTTLRRPPGLSTEGPEQADAARDEGAVLQRASPQRGDLTRAGYIGGPGEAYGLAMFVHGRARDGRWRTR